MPFMTMTDSSAYDGGVILHELWHILDYSHDEPTVKREAVHWYVESSANWFAGFYYESYTLRLMGVFYAQPYLSLWHTNIDKVRIRI